MKPICSRIFIVPIFIMHFAYYGEAQNSVGEHEKLKLSAQCKCDPKKVSVQKADSALSVINHVRSLCSLNAVDSSDSLNQLAQLAANVSNKNGSIRHQIPTTAKCFSLKAQVACEHCLLGRHGNNDARHGSQSRVRQSIFEYIEDYGSQNQSVGHRRWLLYSNLHTVGYGIKKEFSAISIDYYSQERVSSYSDTFYVAYPPFNQISKELFFSRWSFGIPAAFSPSFDNVKVTVKLNEKKLRVDMLPFEDKYGDPTIVWTIPSLYENRNIRPEFVGKMFEVEISNIIVNGVSKSYKYFVSCY